MRKQTGRLLGLDKILDPDSLPAGERHDLDIAGTLIGVGSGIGKPEEVAVKAAGTISGSAFPGNTGIISMARMPASIRKCSFI